MPANKAQRMPLALESTNLLRINKTFHFKFLKTRMFRNHARRPRNDATPATLAASWLVGDQQGAQVLGAARRLLEAEQIARAALPPPLAAVCKVARIERQQITLAVPSAAYASKLRQLAPRIVRLLHESGWNLNEIQVRVQAGLWQSQTKTAARQVIPLDNAALDAFDELRDNLRPGPLADAIGRLLNHHR